VRVIAIADLAAVHYPVDGRSSIAIVPEAKLGALQ
jgi:hypothetical protein